MHQNSEGRLYFPVEPPPGGSRRHGGIQLRDDRIYTCGASGDDRKRSDRSVQGNDGRKPYAAVLSPAELYRLGYPLHVHGRNRQPVAGSVQKRGDSGLLSGDFRNGEGSLYTSAGE